MQDYIDKHIKSQMRVGNCYFMKNDRIQNYIDKYITGQLAVGDCYYMKNENDEDVIVVVLNNCLRSITKQNNDWLRINEYYQDGTTTETYER